MVIYRGVNDHEHRHAQQHPPEAEQPRAEDDGEHDPEAVYADGAAEDLRPDDVAVKLLENDDEDDEHKALERIDEQDDERARHRADERAEEGDDVRHADDDADEQRVGHVQDGADDIAYKPYYGRVEQLAVYEPGEGPVGEVEAAADALRRLDGEDAIQPALGVGGEGLVVGEDVDGDDDADDEVVYGHDDIVHARRHIRHETAQLRQDGGLKPVHQTGVDLADGLHGVLLYLRIVLKQPFHPETGGVYVGAAVFDDGLKTLVQLRDDEIHQGSKNNQQNNFRHEHGQPARKAPSVAFAVVFIEPCAQRPESAVLYRAKPRQKQIAYHKAPQKRTENAHQLFQRRAENRQVVQRHIENYGAGDDAEGRHAPIEVFLIPSEAFFHNTASPAEIYLLYFTIGCMERQHINC